MPGIKDKRTSFLYNRVLIKSFYLLFFYIILFATISTGQQLVLPGAHPDPSVTKIGDTYWASATSSNWFPAFPLMHSKDLINWQQQGYVFNKMPELG